MIRSLYEDVKQNQLNDFHKKTKIKNITTSNFKPDDKGVLWRCRRSHRWNSSYIDVQIHGCPKCFTAGMKQTALEVTQKNFQEIQNTLVTLMQIEKHFETKGMPNFSFNHDAYYHLYLTILLFTGVHLESWIRIKQTVDELERKSIKWEKPTKRGGFKELHTAEKVEAIYKSVVKNLRRYQLSSKGRKVLLRKFRQFREHCLHCVQMRNTIAHGAPHLPYRDGAFHASMARFLRSSTSDSISEYLSEIRGFTDLSDIVLKINNKSMKGNSTLARKERASHIRVAKLQIQSLFGVI